MSCTKDNNGRQWYADGLRFDCSQCGNCCTGVPGYVWFTDDEAEGMADALGLSSRAFFKAYARRIGSRWSLTEYKTSYGYDCVFLKRDEAGKSTCSIYPVRPAQCGTWPFWEENLSSPGAWSGAERRCPGIGRALAGKGKRYSLKEIHERRDVTP